MEQNARQGSMTARISFNAVIEGLKSVDAAARASAMAELSSVGRFGLNTVEALRALQAASEAWPRQAEGPDIASELICAAGRTPRRVYVPVIEEGRLAGIVSIGDVVKTRMDELNSEREQLHTYITRG